MRPASVIVFLIACTANLSEGSYAEINLSLKKENYIIDTIKTNQEVLLAAFDENKKEELDFISDVVKKILEERKTTRFLLGQSKQRQDIEAWFFPGTSEKKAVVIGGVHGTELSAIEIAETLIKKLLSGKKNYYTVIIIPCLFPDNAATAKENVWKIGSTANIGRYSFSNAPDPNRQMPTPGEPFDKNTPIDHLGRVIEKENRLLLQLISVFKPDRIANIHSIRDLRYAGIFADPRTDCRSYALGFETDSSLAVEMASLINRQKGYVPGNELNKKPTALYYKDPPPAAKASFQQRNFSGSSLPFHRGCGITLGTWASTAISEAKDPLMNREAMRIVTIEFPGYKRPDDYKNKKQQNHFRRQIQLYASSIEMIFLGEYFIEENGTQTRSPLVKVVQESLDIQMLMAKTRTILISLNTEPHL